MTTAMSTRRCGFCQCQVPIDSYEHGLSAVCFLIRKWGPDWRLWLRALSQETAPSEAVTDAH